VQTIETALESLRGIGIGHESLGGRNAPNCGATYPVR